MSATSMRAVGIDEHGGTDVLQVRRVPEPEIGAGEVLVRTVASSLNPVDAKTREWEVGNLPANLGWDLAGVVVASKDERFQPGEKVIAMSAQIATGRGTWADVVSLPGDLLAAAPRGVSLEEASTLPLAGLTALQALQLAKVGAGDRVLVVGAVGGVGGLAVQLARHLGAAQVGGLVSRPGHVDAARELGAIEVAVDPATLAEGAYEVVLHTAGPHVTHVLATGGRYVSIADVPLPDVPGASKSYVEQSGEQLAELAALVDGGVLQMRVAADFPVEQVREAHELFEAGGLVGKVVLTFSPTSSERGV
ncbi:NADP-dependent oxidoreductase [Spirillospora sp. NPDC052269]